MGEGGAWAVLYTAQLTQKHKRWHDGVLRQQGGKVGALPCRLPPTAH